MSGITRPRFHFEDHFTMVPNEWARDARIGNRARGLLLQLMSHEPGWVTSVAQLVAANQEGKDAIRTDLNALVAAGYLRRISPDRQVNGRYGGVSWEVTDPFADQGGQPADRGGSAAVAGPPPKKNTKKKNPPTSPEGDTDAPLLEAPPEPVSADFDTFWAAYPRKAGKVAARKAFARAIVRDGSVAVLAGVARFRDDPNLPEQQFIPHPATWLSRGSYGDDPLPPRAEGGPGGPGPQAPVDPAHGADAWMYPERKTTYADYAPQPEEHP